MARKATDFVFEEATPVLRKALATEASPGTPESRQIRFVVSTGDVDRDNDTISADGWELANFLRNPVVLWAHSHSDLPVGKCVSIGVEAGKLVAVTEFATHPFAETVYQLIRGGFMSATSVGFRALEYVRNEVRQGIDFKKQELLEFSIVPVPANAHALIAASAAGVDLEPLRKWVEETVVAWPGELRLKGKAWDKLGQPAISTRKRLGEAEIEVHVSTEQALAHLADIEATVDRVTAKASKLDARVQALATSHGHTRKAVADGEPLRWNRSLSKAFDVAAQEFAPQSQEQKLASDYLGTPIKLLHHGEVRVRSARMGAFLVALDEFVAAEMVHVDDVRNLDYRGQEAPPVYEDIQLNSTTARNFLVDGMRFLQWNGAKLCVRVEPRWFGLSVTHYSVREQANAGCAALEKVQSRAKQLNFLKGEAFTLAGEFLTRGTASVSDLVLDQKNAAAVTRLMNLVNSQGAGMECRGALLVGPPGTGKTLSGRILMDNAKATFIWVSSRDFSYSGGYQGMSDAFEMARECAPTVLFIEDVDNWIDGHTVDLMKTEMDGITQHKGVLTILTTNYPEQLPKALIDRPGRFHDVLRFDLPTEQARAVMLSKWLPGLTPADTTRAVQATAGMSGAHIRELARFAEILASQDGLDKSAALTKALEKLQEQRDLITAVQAQGSRYRAPSMVTAKHFARRKDATLTMEDPMEPGEEAAELIGYQALRAILGQLATLGADTVALVDALIADETETPTETPEAEAAEEAVEAARLAAALALAQQMGGAIAGFCSLVCALQVAETDDGDDATVMQLSTTLTRQKRGRVLSHANEMKLRKAMEHSTNCQGAIDEVLRALPPEQPDDAEDGKAVVLEIAETEPMTLELAAPVIDGEFVLELRDEDGIEIDDAALRAALTEVVGGGLGEMVRAATQRTLNQMRGRVD